MGKQQSKLAADELADLQKNTYCEWSLPRVRWSCPASL